MACTPFSKKNLGWLAFVSVLALVWGDEDGAETERHKTTITKTLSFPEFSTSVNPRIEHDVKLLGSAKLSNDKRSIQIPDSSETDDLRHQAGRVIYSSPIRVFDPSSHTPASFDTTFSFQFNNHTLSADYDSTLEEAHGGRQADIIRWQAQPPNLSVFEPGLAQVLMARTAAPPNGNVIFQAMNLHVQVNNSQMIMVATDVQTKMVGIGRKRKLNLTSWDQALRQILRHTAQQKIMVIKCPLPHNATTALSNIIVDVEVDNPIADDFPVCWVPEFFSAGTALNNLRNPSRVVISHCLGNWNFMEVVADFYRMAPNWVANNNVLLYGHHAPTAIGVMGANVILAFKAILMETMTQFCESITGEGEAGIEQAREIITTDPRIGNEFLDVTAGLGGRALLRDVMYFKHMAELVNNKPAIRLFDYVIKCHEEYKEQFVSQILDQLNSLEQKIIIILGFSYKPNTSDVDNSAAIDICKKLVKEKARIRINDPRAPAADIVDCFPPSYTQGNNARITVHQNVGNNNNLFWQGANAICFLQNWEQYDQIDFGQILQFTASKVYLFDTCGALQPNLLQIHQLNQNVNPPYIMKIRGHA